MKRILLWLIATLVVVFVLLLFRSRTRNKLDVAPDARQQIEKARRR